VLLSLLSVAVVIAAEIAVASSLLLKHSRELDRSIIGKYPLLHCIVVGFGDDIVVRVENPVTTSQNNMDANANTATASRWVFLIADEDYSSLTTLYVVVQ
jgi:hypothetical protein